MLRFAIASSILSVFGASALQFPATFECKFCRELTQAVLPRAIMLASNVRPPNIPGSLWSAIRESLPEIASDPSCYGTCVNPQAHWLIPGIVSKRNVSCQLCQQLMQIGKPLANGSESNFEEKLETTCKNLDFLEAVCQMIVSEHGKEMFALEKQNMEPVAACIELKIC